VEPRSSLRGARCWGPLLLRSCSSGSCCCYNCTLPLLRCLAPSAMRGAAAAACLLPATATLPACLLPATATATPAAPCLWAACRPCPWRHACWRDFPARCSSRWYSPSPTSPPQALPRTRRAPVEGSVQKEVSRSCGAAAAAARPSRCAYAVWYRSLGYATCVGSSPSPRGSDPKGGGVEHGRCAPKRDPRVHMHHVWGARVQTPLAGGGGRIFGPSRNCRGTVPPHPATGASNDGAPCARAP
jgi:hypothetical protein